jgi:hypothetical protein
LLNEFYSGDRKYNFSTVAGAGLIIGYCSHGNSKQAACELPVTR